MKKITQEEFNKLGRNEYGFIVVPAFSDLREIKTFPKHCIFSDRCRFSDGCKFSDRCEFGYDCKFGERS